MEKTAIILAGGVSERFGQDKGLVQMAGKPLVLHIFDIVRDVVEEVIVVVSSDRQGDFYSPLLPKRAKISVDVEDSQSPLVGASTGFMSARGDYSILLPCDTPFVSKEVIKLLFELSRNMDAVIPRWPNGYIEPLQAVYRTSSALTAAKEAIEKGEARLQSMISLLKRVRYLSTIVIEEMNHDLTTFFNVNDAIDLKRAENLIKKKMVT
jgi:molybdopterin-guanine dinucleotide biosynthesis protein A